MIVVGLDVHKHSLTAVAVDEVGRPVAEQTVGEGRALLEWAALLGAERLWALEQRRAGRERGRPGSGLAFAQSCRDENCSIARPDP